MRIGCGRFQPEFPQDIDRRARIDRKPRPHDSARRIIDLIEQPRGELDELPSLFFAVCAGLNIEISQHTQQRRANIDAFPPGKRHQPVEARKSWRCGHA